MTAVLLVPANAAVPSALRQIAVLKSAAPKSSITILTPVPSIAEFLTPLEQLGIGIRHVPDDVAIRPLRPWTWLSERARLRKTLSRFYPAAKDVRCYFYGASFSAMQIAAMALAAERKQGIVLEDWDHSEKVGLRDHRAKGPLATLFSLCARFIVRGPVHLIRPEAPFLILSREYVERVARIVPPEKPATAGSSLHQKILDKVSQTSHARVLWVYDLYEEHYGPELIDPSAFQNFWRQLSHLVISLVDSTSQAYKAHPRSRQKPAVFSQLQEVDRSIPVEFLRTPALKLVIGLSSYALNHFASQKNICVISTLDLLPAPESIKNSEQITLDKWVDPENRVLRPATMEDFASYCRKALGN
jgi:hypothetical protein